MTQTMPRIGLKGLRVSACSPYNTAPTLIWEENKSKKSHQSGEQTQKPSKALPKVTFKYPFSSHTLWSSQVAANTEAESMGLLSNNWASCFRSFPKWAIIYEIRDWKTSVYSRSLLWTCGLFPACVRVLTMCLCVSFHFGLSRSQSHLECVLAHVLWEELGMSVFFSGSCHSPSPRVWGGTVCVSAGDNLSS